MGKSGSRQYLNAACLVRMAELHDDAVVFTTDGDFRADAALTRRSFRNFHNRHTTSSIAARFRTSWRGLRAAITRWENSRSARWQAILNSQSGRSVVIVAEKRKNKCCPGRKRSACAPTRIHVY